MKLQEICDRLLKRYETCSDILGEDFVIVSHISDMILDSCSGLAGRGNDEEEFNSFSGLVEESYESLFSWSPEILVPDEEIYTNSFNWSKLF